MVALHAAIGVWPGVVKRFRDQLVDDSKPGSGQLGCDLTRTPMGYQRALKEPCGRRDVALLRDIDVDDLAVLIHVPVDVTPDAGNLDVSLVREPSIVDTATTRPGRVDQKRREPLHPSVNRDVINLIPRSARSSSTSRCDKP